MMRTKEYSNLRYMNEWSHHASLGSKKDKVVHCILRNVHSPDIEERREVICTNEFLIVG